MYSLSHYQLSFNVELQDGQLALAADCLDAAKAIAERLPRSRRLQLELDMMRSELAVESGGSPSIEWMDYRRLAGPIRSANPRLWQTILAVLLLHPRAKSRRSQYSAIQSELKKTLDSLANSGWQDFAVYSLAVSHLEYGERDKAVAEIKLYFEKNRAGRAKLRPKLGSLATELGITLSVA